MIKKKNPISIGAQFNYLTFEKEFSFVFLILSIGFLLEKRIWPICGPNLQLYKKKLLVQILVSLDSRYTVKIELNSSGKPK